MRVVVFPANHLADVLTNKTKRHRENTQLNKPKQLNNKHKLTMIWSYAYDLWSGNED